MPIGAWSGESWADIGEAIYPREEAKETQLYLADQLVLDGEPGMVEGLEHLPSEETFRLAFAGMRPDQMPTH